MGKVKNFSSKMNKVSIHAICTVCGGIISNVKMVQAVTSESGSMQFKEKMIKVCKCNEEEIYNE